MPANGSPMFQPEDAHHPQMRATGSIPGRHSGPNAVDERLIGRMKKLNLDGAPRSIDNVRSPFEQDLILDLLDLPPFDPHNPISVCRGYTLFRNRRMFGVSPHWGPEITPRPMNLQQEELRTMILRGKKKKGSLSQKLNELGESKRAHLDNLTKLHNRNDDQRVEWSLAYLDPVMGQEMRGTGGRFATIREIKSIDIILVRKPKAGVSSNQFYSPSAPFGRNSSEDYLRPQVKEYRPPNSDVKPKEMAGPGRDTGLPSRTREYRDDFDTPEGKPFKEKSGQGRDSGFVQLSPPRAGEYRPPHPGDDFDAPEPKAFKEKSGQGRDPAFDRAREYHDFNAPEAKAFKEKSGQGRDAAFDRAGEQGHDPKFNQFSSPQAGEYHPPESGFDQFPPRDGAYRPHDAPDVSGPGRHPGFDHFPGNYQPPRPDAPDVSGPGRHPVFDQFNGPRPPPTPAPGFGQGGIPHQLPNGGQHPMMQPPPTSKAHSVPAHVPGGEPPRPPTMASMAPPMATMPPGLGPQPPGAHGGYPSAPGPTNGHMGAQHHNDFGPARKVGKAGEANRPFTPFDGEFPQDPNKLKREPKKYHTSSRPPRVVKVQTGPLLDDYDTDSSFDGHDSASSLEDDSSVSSFSPFDDFKTLKPRLSRGSLHNRQDHSRERIHRSHTRKQPQKSYRDETANPHRQQLYHRSENRTHPSELVTIIPGGGVNPRREQSIRRRENQPIQVLHTHTRPRLDYPSEKSFPRDFQERRDERTWAARDELRELELRGFELRQYLLEKDKLAEMTRQQLRPKIDHYNRYGDDLRQNPRLTAYRGHDQELYSRAGHFYT